MKIKLSTLLAHVTKKGGGAGGIRSAMKNASLVSNKKCIFSYIATKIIYQISTTYILLMYALGNIHIL